MANLFHIALHMAQKENVPPDWFDFEQRDEHDLDKVAQQFISIPISDEEKDDRLWAEYNREDRYWKIIYYSYELFKSQYNACIEWLLANKRRGANPEVHRSTFTSISAPPAEPSDEIKEQVKERDGYRCLCCGDDSSLLQVDHINPKYRGGDHSLNNLQTLCGTCNQIKETREIDFRIHQTCLTVPPSEYSGYSGYIESGYAGGYELLFRRSINFFYSCDAVKSVKIGDSWADWYRWEVSLHASNNPGWLIPHLKKSVREIRQVRSKKGLVGPNEIIITAPGFDVVEPLTG